MTLFEKIAYSTPFTPIYNTYRFFVSRFEALCRFWAYGKNGYNTVDFDAMCLYDDIHLRLTRCYDVFKNHSHLEWNSDEDSELMVELREAIDLSGKLSSPSYAGYHSIYEVYDNFTTKEESDTHRTILDSIDKPNRSIITPKEFDKLISEAYEKDISNKFRDMDRLFYLLRNKLEHWWD